MSTPTAAAPAAGADSDYPRVQLLIDGDWCDGGAGEEPVYNPATAAVIGTVPHADRGDLDRALAAAARGFAQWRAMPIDERSQILHRAAGLIRERAAQIAAIMCLEQGKPIAQGRGECMGSAKLLDFYVEEARRHGGRFIPADADTQLSVIHDPVGPVAAFVPWNFPAGGPNRKLAGALAAGCSIVIKPSEETPATVCEIVRCYADAGVPAGVINVVFGVPADISEYLIASPIIRLLAFTGSVPVGKHLAALAAAQMKPTLMELGGHAPVIVCADADPQVAAQRTAAAKFANAGQVCTSPSRIMVHASRYDDFVATFVAAARAVSVGDGRDPATTMGPMANPRRLQAAVELTEDAVARGATLAAGGHALDGPGWFYAPTVLLDVPADAQIMSIEPFCPVAPINAFDDLEDALAIANGLPYGLAAYAYTESAATANRLTHALEAGILSINHCGGSVPEAPSGGVKESGHGKEGGAEGLHDYLITKRVSHKLR